jgi:DNA excision repair protein ERCC-6-like 2
MVSYDLDGSETESDGSHGPGLTTKLPSKVRRPGAAVQKSHAVTHERNKTLDKSVAEVHGFDTSESSSSGEVVGLDQYGENEPPRKRRHLPLVELEGLEWSDEDSANDGETAYKRFQSKKSDRRKRAIRSTKKAKAIEMENRQREGGKTSTGVGKRVSKTKKGSESKEKIWADASSDEELMEWTVPDYLKQRRARFDARAEKLKAGGLKLPPAYDETSFSDDELLERLAERPQFSADPPGKYQDIQLPYSLGLIPAPIAQWLRDYQVQGAEFLHELFVYQKGGILGDDMGLGKTVQVIAFMAAAYGKTGDERDDKRMRKMRRSHNSWYPRTLIICPGTLISNWQDEFRRWGWWHVDVYHGSAEAKDAAISAAQSGRTEVMITTYTTYRTNKDIINMVAWDCCVADECHAIKERKSETTHALNEANALCRIGLTGTAIQNKYEELWTLLNWTNPGRFGPISTWKASICDPLELGQSHNATVYQLSRARKTAKKLVENLLPQFFLRRMKTLIKDQLPKKSDRVIFCPLTQTQADAYERFLDGDIVQYIRQSAELCACGSGKKMGWCCYALLPDGSKWQNHVFPAISALQRLSNHLAILIPQSSDTSEKQDKDLELLRTCVPDQWRKLYAERDSILHYSNPEFCGKWRILKKLLKFWHGEGNNKVLVFSHSVRLLKMLQMLFNHTSYSVSYLDGSMKYEDRYAVVTDFNTDPSQFVFLISTRSGGVGLNITSANKVVVVDPNWNPSYDLQAQDRAYRIGQTRDVEVFRLVSQGTLEEIVYARQIYKQQQANIGYNATSERRYFQGVRGRQDQKGEIFGLNNLFAYQNDNVVLKDIVNKTNIAESKADLRITSLELEDDKDDDMKEDIADEDDPLHASMKTEDDNGEAAISQLAALITSDGSKAGKKKRSFKSDLSKIAKHDPVQAILSSAGVQYTHENSEVIGSSKVEADLSKRAEAAVEGGSTQEQSARVFVADSQSQALKNGQPNVGHQTKGIRYQYNPSESVKKRQFCSMARWTGYKDVVEFALVVEGWTQEERRTCLDRFYEWRRGFLAGDEDFKDEQKGLMKPDAHDQLKAEDDINDDGDDEL